MSGIDNLVSHIENNQSQKDGIISGAEWQLVAKVLGESSREEGETFSKQDIRKLDKEQQQQAKKDNAVEKNNKEYNNSLKKAQEVLNNPEHVKQLLHMCEVQAKLIKNGADVVYYESFLNSIPVGLQADDTIKQSINDTQKMLDEKRVLNITGVGENSSITISENPRQVRFIPGKDPNISLKSSNVLQYEALHGAINAIGFQEIQEMIKKLEKIGLDINEFTNDVNEGLKTGKFDMKKMDKCGGVGYVLGELKGKFGNTIAERKIAIQKLYTEAPKMITELDASPLPDSEKQMIKNMLPIFKSVLDALADPNSQLSLYIDHIAEPLAQQINGTLDYSNLESDQSKKAILNIFHRNPIEFNHLTDDFNSSDQTKKNNAEKVITTYYKIDTGKDLPAGVKVEFVSDMVIQSEVKDAMGKIIAPKIEKPGFKFKNTDGTFIKGDDKGDTVVYFGEEKTGNGQSFEQLLGANGPQWAKDLYKAKDGTVQLDMKTVADLAQQVNFEGGTKVKPTSSLNVYSNMSEAIKGFFDHPLFKQLQEALYTLMGLIGTDEQREKAALDLNRMRSLNTIKARNESVVTRKNPGGKLMIDVIKDNDYAFKEENMSYKDKEGKEQRVKINTKSVFANMTYEEQRFFLENILSGDAQKVQVAKDSMIAIHNNENPISTNTDKSKDETSEKTQENSIQGKEFKDGVLYPELSIDGNLPGKVELKDKNTDTPYLIVDGQAIALVKNKETNLYEGALSTLAKDKKMYIKNIAFDKDLNNIAIKSEEAKGINNSNNRDEYLQKFYQGGKYNLDYILNNPGGGNIGFLALHSSQIFPEDGDKVKNIYDTITSKLSTQLPDVQKIFVDLQYGLSDMITNDENYTKQNLKTLIDKTKNDLLTIKGSGSTPILQAQVDAWYSQFDFGATPDKPSTQKKPVETPVAPVAGEKKV